jgi:hypothetical protein
MELVFDFLPQGRSAQALFNPLLQVVIAYPSTQAKPISNVVEDALIRKGGGLLKDHPYSPAQIRWGKLEKIRFGKLDFPCQSCVRNGLAHPIEGSQKRGFAAAGRSDKSCDPLPGYCETEIMQGLEFSIEEVQVRNYELRRRHLFDGFSG